MAKLNLKEVSDSIVVNDIAQRQINEIAKKCERIKPLLVIRCITYNHGKYLRDALEGFLMQKTDFPFVAIVHDDASTDNTVDIIREYAAKYPDIILPIFEEENQYSKKDRSVGKIMNAATFAAGARYIALCEGDDYWTDPSKLQKQVSFLESYPDYSMCFHNAIEHWENTNLPDKQFSQIEDRDYSAIEFVQNWIVPTASVVCNSRVTTDKRMQELNRSGKLIAGDILLFLTCTQYGKVHGMSDVSSVYRRLETGAVKSYIDTHPYEFMIHEITLAKAFGGDIKKFFKHKVANRAILCLSEFKKTRKFDTHSFLRAFYFTPFKTIRQFIRYI